MDAALLRGCRVIPKLKPTTADQFDFTYEWYFSSAGSFTAALFYKKFNDYIIKASVDEQLTNNDVTRTVNVTRPINADGASVTGFELAYQTFFDRLPAPWNGLGIQTNFTYVDNKGVENSGLTIVSGDGGTNQDDQITLHRSAARRILRRLAYNIVLMFEQEKYSARLAYNWRDDLPDQPGGLLYQTAHLAGCVRPARRVGPLQAKRELGHLPRRAESDPAGDRAASAGQPAKV